ncbi:MAG TPA: hypothetical protein VFD78_00615 [Chitinophagaceae bacterium]|nr:hypothetical protein [Chitinophagaceae bacterium]
MKSHSELTLTGDLMTMEQPIFDQQLESCSSLSSKSSDLEENLLSGIDLTSILDLNIIGLAKKSPKKPIEEDEDDFDAEIDEEDFEEEDFDFDEDFEDDFEDLDYIDDDIDFDDDFF